MRVLTFLHSYELGGVERVALRLVRAWRAEGHDAQLVLGRADGVMSAEFASIDAEILSDGNVSTAWWETLYMIYRLPGVIRRRRPDVLFCAGNSYAIVSVAMKVRLGRACPPIVIKISNDLVRRDLPAVVRPIYRCWLRLQGRLLDRFVAIAPPMRNEIAALCRLPVDQVAVVDDPALDALPAPSRPRAGAGRRYVAVGRLSAQKRFHLLIEAFARIAGPDDRLTIYGEGSDRAALTRRAAATNVGDRVDLPGFLPDAAARIGEHDVFVLSSEYEGVPAAVIEALAAGITIVATDCAASMRDLLGDGALGTLVPVGDVTALAAAMRSAPAPHREAQRRQAIRFTISATAPAWWRVFEEARLS